MKSILILSALGLAFAAPSFNSEPLTAEVINVTALGDTLNGNNSSITEQSEAPAETVENFEGTWPFSIFQQVSEDPEETGILDAQSVDPLAINEDEESDEMQEFPSIEEEVDELQEFPDIDEDLETTDISEYEGYEPKKAFTETKKIFIVKKWVKCDTAEKICHKFDAHIPYFSSKKQLESLAKYLAWKRIPEVFVYYHKKKFVFKVVVRIIIKKFDYGRIKKFKVISFKLEKALYKKALVLCEKKAYFKKHDYKPVYKKTYEPDYKPIYKPVHKKHHYKPVYKKDYEPHHKLHYKKYDYEPDYKPVYKKSHYEPDYKPWSYEDSDNVQVEESLDQDLEAEPQFESIQEAGSLEQSQQFESASGYKPPIHHYWPWHYPKYKHPLKQWWGHN